MTDQIIELQKKLNVDPDGILGPLTLKAAAKYFKLSPEKAAHFFGQCSHETNDFRVFVENLNYSATGLLSVHGKYFDNDPDLASKYQRQPEKIANRVYANRLGNGPEESGDGWKYRGRGAVQLTGKNNYTAFSQYMNDPEIVTNPDIVATKYPFDCALFFFKEAKLWEICEYGVNDATIKALTIKISGKMIGYDERRQKTYNYYKILTEIPKEYTQPVPVPQTQILSRTKLSPNFNLSEFTKSETAVRENIKNEPNPQQIENLRAVCTNILEPVYTHFNMPNEFIVSSGFRGPELNRFVGGSPKSQHCTGEAVDFEIIGISNHDLAKWISENCEYDQLIMEYYNPEQGPNSGWIHASYSRSGRNRKENLTSIRIGPKIVYKNGFMS